MRAVLDGVDRVHQAFEEQASRTPQQCAIVVGDRRMTYVELEHAANAVANALLDRGLSPGDLVGVCLRQTLSGPPVSGLSEQRRPGAKRPAEQRREGRRRIEARSHSERSSPITHCETAHHQVAGCGT